MILRKLEDFTPRYGYKYRPKSPRSLSKPLSQTQHQFHPILIEHPQEHSNIKMVSMTLPTSLQKSLDETKVDYVNLGSSGLQISVPILGAMSFGSKQWSPWLLEEEEAIKVLAAAYERGINTWDTANMYGNGLSEEILGKAIKDLKIPRQKVVIMTKCAIHVGEDFSVVGPVHGQFMRKSKQYVNQGGESSSNLSSAACSGLRLR